jgi:DNA-binding NtrC family response regulator
MKLASKQEWRKLFCIDIDIDLTERKQAEAEQEKLQTRFLQAQKMQSVGLLAGGVAHDFNNMLGIIRLASEHAGRIDLLLTDVVMPGMNGRDLAKSLSSTCPGLKRLFMSGDTADIIARHGVMDEGAHFIQKPFSLKDLAAKLREALEE